MSVNCRWCRKRPATQLDHDTLPEGDDGDVCWREWNSYADCYRIEDRMKDAAPDMLEALEMIMPQSPRRGECDGYDFAMWENARSAIAKAKGEKQ